MAPLDLLEKYTYADYKRWEGRWELIGGSAYAMAPAPYPIHQKVVLAIAKELDKELECKECELFISPIDWYIDEENVVQPDVAIFCEPINEDKPYMQTTPPLIVEVLSLSTALKDLTIKFSLYERAGVKYYFVINPKTKEYEIFELIDGKYKLVCKDCKEFCFEWEGCKVCIKDIKKVIE